MLFRVRVARSRKYISRCCEIRIIFRNTGSDSPPDVEFSSRKWTLSNGRNAPPTSVNRDLKPRTGPESSFDIAILGFFSSVPHTSGVSYETFSLLSSILVFRFILSSACVARCMARKNKENKNMALSTILRDEGDSSEDDYRRKRDKNNQAVKRSRVKSRMRTQQTLQRVNQLKTENDMLEEKIKLLSKELGFLKELFMAQAGTSQIELPKSVDLKTLLSDTTSDILDNDLTKNPSSS